MNEVSREEGCEEVTRKTTTKKGGLLFMCGYLPGASPLKTSFSSLEAVNLPEDPNIPGDSWKDVSGGGCGFAMAVSDSGKLITWGSAEDQGLCYLTAGKHEEIPKTFPLPTDKSIVTAAAGWAHCVSVTEAGEIYTWGWNECVPTVKVFSDMKEIGNLEKDSSKSHSPSLTEEPASEVDKITDNKKEGQDTAKRRKISLAKLDCESPTSVNETLLSPPCLVPLGQGVKICYVAAGGRHTLALSGTLSTSRHLLQGNMGQVWGWGYGGEGQLGLGTRIKTVSSPHLIPCVETSAYKKDSTSLLREGSLNLKGQVSDVPSSYVKRIACGGRHSAVITDSGALFTFGWGLYGQCGNGSTNDELRPKCVSSLVGTKMEGIAAGLWHTVCISAEGRVYVFGGNQFGQLGTGEDQAETLPKLLDTPNLEDKHAKGVSCGARHSVIMTDDDGLFSWGWNKYGQLGLGDVIDRSTPSQVPLEGCHLKNVACGWWHTLVLADSA